MRKNGRPNLGYSNVYWKNVDRGPEAKIYNRKELIHEVLSEAIQLPDDNLQILLQTEEYQGEHSDETRCIEITERDESDRNNNVEAHRHAV